MTLTLKRKKENLANYIRSFGSNTTGLSFLGKQAIIEKTIVDSYKELDQPKELVDLVQTIEVTTQGGIYEESDFDSETLEKIELDKLPEIDKDTNKVDFEVKTFSGYINFSKEQLDDGQYNINDFLGKKILKLERKTRNKEIGKVLKTATQKTASSIDDLKDVISLLNPERNITMVVSQSLFNVLEKVKDGSGNPLLKVDKLTGTTETFYINNFLVVSDNILGNKGDKLAFIGDLEKFVTLFDRMKATIQWSFISKLFSHRLILFTRFDVKKVEADCGYLVTWN
ncbi:phage major capsid protein [Streptococcus ruminantium]|uniref:phage major capsid protein n=1 Tax=Streptococcus ruminantium TaxID=1917441 RepID=UPI0012DF9680|nr:phage major capsid protein [Streptococcus ruminantium]